LVQSIDNDIKRCEIQQLLKFLFIDHKTKTQSQDRTKSQNNIKVPTIVNKVNPVSVNHVFTRDTVCYSTAGGFEQCYVVVIGSKRIKLIRSHFDTKKIVREKSFYLKL